MKQWLIPGTADVMAIGGGIGKPKGNMQGELTVKFTGQCFVCGPTCHRMFKCWWKDDKFAKSPSPSKSGDGKSGRKRKGKGNVTSESHTRLKFCGLTDTTFKSGSGTHGQSKKHQKVSQNMAEL